MWTISWVCHSKKVYPRTRPNVFLTHWSKPACLFTPSLVPVEGRLQAGSSIRGGQLLGVSRRGLWRLRIALLHVASFGLGERRRNQFLGWPLHVSGSSAGRAPATFTAAYAFSQSGGGERRRLSVPVIRELRVAASLIFLAHRDLSAPCCSAHPNIMSHPSNQLSVQNTTECMGYCLFGEFFASCRKSGMKWPVPPLKMEMWGTHVTLSFFICLIRFFSPYHS